MALTTFSGPVKSNNGFITGGAGSSVTIAADTTLTVAAHAGKMLVVTDNNAVITLPAIVSAGNRETNSIGSEYNVFMSVTAAAGLTVETDGTDKYVGQITLVIDNSATTKSFAPAAANDKINLNGTTKGGIAGTYIKITAVAANKYLVQATVNASGTLATPFGN